MSNQAKILSIIATIFITIISSLNTNIFFICMGIYFVSISIVKPNFNFYILIMVCFGLAVNLILSYRVDIGIPITILDVLIIVLAVNILLSLKEFKDDTEHKYSFLIYMYVIFSVYALSKGLITKYPMYNILKDARVPAYFIIVYYYSKVKVKTITDLKKIIVVLLISGVIVSIQQIFIFIYKGTTTNFESFALRDVSLPIMTAILAMILMTSYFKEFPLFQRLKFAYLGLLLLFITAITMSLTRSIWISLALTYLTYFLLLPSKRVKIYKPLLFSVIALLTTVITTQYIDSVFDNNIFNLVITRLQSTFAMLTNGSDTLIWRFNVANYAAKQIGLQGILIGQGFGSHFILPAALNIIEIDIVGLENSFMHYCWKFGIVGSIFTFLMFIFKIYEIYTAYKKNINCRYSKLILALFCHCFVTFIVGIWSMVINLAYFMPWWGLLLGIRYDRILSNIDADNTVNSV